IDRAADVIAAVREEGLDGIVVIGGDGTQAIALRLFEHHGLNVVGVPKTIDNDLSATDLTFGFYTAVEVATEALDRLHTTADSHDRVLFLEVMGRDAGHIALHAGIAGGADVILLPEIPYSLDKIAQKIDSLRRKGRNSALVVVSEAVRTVEGKLLKVEYRGGARRLGGIGHYFANLIYDATGAETRVTVLGHVQRGSPPTAQDRLIGTAFGVHAVDLIAECKFDRMVAWQNRRVVDVPLADAIQ